MMFEVPSANNRRSFYCFCLTIRLKRKVIKINCSFCALETFFIDFSLLNSNCSRQIGKYQHWKSTSVVSLNGKSVIVRLIRRHKFIDALCQNVCAGVEGDNRLSTEYFWSVISLNLNNRRKMFFMRERLIDCCYFYDRFISSAATVLD